MSEQARERYANDSEYRKGLLKWYSERYINDLEFRKAKIKRVKESCYRNRLKVLSHYSGGSVKCACCGECHIEFLVIDHINGGGHRHRREIGAKSSPMFYNWLKKNNYPDGFQVLCHNCNSSKGFYGYCPHNNSKNVVQNSKNIV